MSAWIASAVRDLPLAFGPETRLIPFTKPERLNGFEIPSSLSIETHCAISLSRSPPRSRPMNVRASKAGREVYHF